MSPPKTLVTVVMPCYNSAAYLREGVESVLTQTYCDLELIVVDDGSTDASLEVLKGVCDDRLRVMQHGRNQGICRSLNDGIRAARGEFVARMDADDLCDPDRIEKQVDAMQADVSLVIVGTDVRIVDANGLPLYTVMTPKGDGQIRKALNYELPIWPGSQMWRRSVILEAGLFDEGLPVHEDLELTLRLSTFGRLANVPGELYIYRKNASGESNVHFIQGRAWALTARRAFYLKRVGRTQQLPALYDGARRRYDRERFEKGVAVPAKNQGYYHQSLGLGYLVRGRRAEARTCLANAARRSGRSSLWWGLWLAAWCPNLIVSALYRLNVLGKKVIYFAHAGRVPRQPLGRGAA